MKAVPAAAATLAIAAPMALAGLPGPPVLSLGIGGEGSPQAGHSYTYLVSVSDPTRTPGWLVHLDVSVPAGATVVAAGGAGACRTGPDGVSCVWPQLIASASVTVAVTVSLAPGLRVGTALAATVRLSYDWGQLTDSATSVRTVTGPPPPKPPAKPKPRPEPTRTSPPRSLPSSPPPRNSVIPPPAPRVSPGSRPSQLGAGTSPAVVRPQRVTGRSRPPRPRPSRPPSSRPLFPRTASQLIAPPPRLPVKGLSKGLLIVLVMAPCVAAAVTRFARGR